MNIEKNKLEFWMLSFFASVFFLVAMWFIGPVLIPGCSECFLDYSFVLYLPLGLICLIIVSFIFSLVKRSISFAKLFFGTFVVMLLDLFLLIVIVYSINIYNESYILPPSIKCGILPNRDTCYLQYAHFEKDADICLKIDPKGYLQNLCIATVAPITKDYSVCEKSGAPGSCYNGLYYQAMSMADSLSEKISFCEKIGSDYKKQDCYKSCIEYLENADYKREGEEIRKSLSFCEEVRDSFTKARCFDAFASVLGDESICEMIPDKHRESFKDCPSS